jgi:NAD+ diphosphatase
MSAPATYRFCPYDGHALEPRPADRRLLGHCAHCGFVDYQNPKPTVDVVIVADGRILLGRRAHEPRKGEWDIVGGFIDAAETSEDAVIREVFEETGLRVRITDYLGSMPDVYGERSIPTLSFCYIVEIVEGTPRAGDDIEKVQWFAPAELPATLAFEHQPRILALAVRRMRERAGRA